MPTCGDRTPDDPKLAPDLTFDKCSCFTSGEWSRLVRVNEDRCED